MNKMITVISMALVIGFGLVFSNAYAEEMSKGWNRAYEVSEVIGSNIRSPEGEDLGKIRDFVFDSDGRLAFAIVAYGGFLEAGEKLIAVPFGALTYDLNQEHLVLNISKEKLESAPGFDRSALLNPRWAEDTYWHFGLQPYWSEEGVFTEWDMEGFSIEEPTEQQRSEEFLSPEYMQ
jgi:hypothetical protein